MSEQDQMMLLGFLIAITGMALIRQARLVFGHAKFEYEYMKHPRLVKYDDEKQCEEPHTWRVVELALRGLPFGEYQICMKCGTISGNLDYMVSEQVLAQVQEAQKILAQKEALEREVQDRIEGYAAVAVDRAIYREFPMEAKDLTFVRRIHELVEYSHEARIEAAKKVASELEAQQSLNKKYDSWETKVKGNA